MNNFLLNVHGFNKLSHCSDFKKLIRSNDFLFGSFLETYFQQRK